MQNILIQVKKNYNLLLIFLKNKIFKEVFNLRPGSANLKHDLNLARKIR